MTLQNKLQRQDILVVDDDVDSLNILVAMLEEAGYAVRAAATPALALQSAMSLPPALILLDIGMPGMNGFEVCRRLKEDARTQDVPIIFVSGQTDVTDKVRGFDLGAVDFISKPFQRQEILASVRTHLALREAHEKLKQRVTERTAAMAENISQLREMEAAMNLAGFGIHRADEHTGRLFYVNDYFCQLNGYTRDEMLGMTILELNPNLPALPFHEIAEPFRQNGGGRFETLHRHKDGHDIPVEIILYYRRPNDGIPGHFVGFTIDVSQRKAADQALAEHQENLERSVQKRTAELKASEARNRAIVTTMLDSVVHIDAQGTMLFVNFAVQDLFGYAEDEMIGRNVAMLMPEPIASAHDSYLAHYQKTRQPHIVGNRREVTARRKDGSLFPIELAVNEMVDDAGSSFFGVIRDMTNQKAIERVVTLALRDAEQAAKAKSTFLTNMSHEIRTPLNAILGLTQIGMRDSQDTKFHQIFNRLRDSGGHLLAVVNDILDYSKLEAGKVSIEKRPFALFSVLDNVKNFVTERAEAKGLELSISMSPDLSDWVEGDSLRLTQILTNLLANAIKFTERGGVRLRAARDGDDIHFRVIDTGIGMSEAQTARLFQPFEQADISTTRNYGGTGLGLAISRNLALLMGGNISVDSALGTGSSFFLQLPLPAVDSPAQLNHQETLPAVAGARLAGVSILAADDVEINRLILEDLLTHEGARIIFAVDGQQALERLQEMGVSAFDVVLMDVQMPVMDGLEATQHLLKIAPALPVIGLTAHAMAEERDKCFRAGMVDHVVKPVDLNILVAAILRHVRLKTQHAPNAPTVEATDNSVYAGCNDPAIIDLGILAGRVGNDPAKIAKYTTRFIETSRDTLSEMQAALAHEDLPTLSALGHRLKSAARTVGAMRFGDICQQIESPKTSNNLEEAQAEVEQLLELFEQIAQRVKHVSD